MRSMTTDNRVLARELEEALAELPMFDVHTHLVGGHLGARGLHDILLYHMMISDLYAAGCPSGARLTQFPGWPTREEAHARIAEAVPYLPFIRNTSCSWALRLILRGPLRLARADHGRQLAAARRDHPRARRRPRRWYSILDRLNIRRTCTESARRGQGEDDDRLQYSIEWCFFTRSQWGEFDTALYELERAWGRSPEVGHADRRRTAPAHRPHDPHPGRRPRRRGPLRGQPPLRSASSPRRRGSPPTSTSARSATPRWPPPCRGGRKRVPWNETSMRRTSMKLS